MCSVVHVVARLLQGKLRLELLRTRVSPGNYRLPRSVRCYSGNDLQLARSYCDDLASIREVGKRMEGTDIVNRQSRQEKQRLRLVSP